MHFLHGICLRMSACDRLCPLCCFFHLSDKVEGLMFLIIPIRKHQRILPIILMFLMMPAAWGADGKGNNPIIESESMPATAVSQGGLWQEVSRYSSPATQIQQAVIQQHPLPRKYRMLELNVKAPHAAGVIRNIRIKGRIL